MSEVVREALDLYFETHGIAVDEVAEPEDVRGAA